MNLALFVKCKLHVCDVAIRLGMDRFEARSSVRDIETFDDLLSFVYFLRDAYNAPEDVLNVNDVVRLDLYLAPWELYNEWELA